MKRGPKVYVTQEAAISNIRTVWERIGKPDMLTLRLYNAHGSFHSTAIGKKWKWIDICALAGVPCGVRGSKKKEWKVCIQCNKHQTTSYHCYGCRRTIHNRSGGIE